MSEAEANEKRVATNRVGKKSADWWMMTGDCGRHRNGKARSLVLVHQKYMDIFSLSAFDLNIEKLSVSLLPSLYLCSIWIEIFSLIESKIWWWVRSYKWLNHFLFFYFSPFLFLSPFYFRRFNVRIKRWQLQPDALALRCLIEFGNQRF